MRVEKISFTGFRSLRDLNLDLGDLTVITGPNNAGKSNLLAGLAFLGDVYSRGLDQAMLSAGGYDQIAFRYDGEPVGSVTFELGTVLDEVDMAATRAAYDRLSITPPEYLRASHRFTLGIVDDESVASYTVQDTSLEIADQNGQSWLGPIIEHDPRRSFGPEPESGARIFAVDLLNGSRRSTFRNLRATDSPGPAADLESLMWDPVERVWDGVMALRVVQPMPQVCRRPGVRGPNPQLGRYGENLAAVADHMRRTDPEAWTQVQEEMSAVVPRLTRIDIVPTEDRMLALRFGDEGARRAWTAGEVSDGTIQVLALIIALFDTRIPALGIEEPENSLHPWILREFVRLCMKESRKQVVMTTHSPVVVNYVPADAVHLMWQHSGESRIEKILDLDPQIRSMWESGESRLFDLYDSGWIQDATPPEARGE